MTRSRFTTALDVRCQCLVAHATTVRSTPTQGRLISKCQVLKYRHEVNHVEFLTPARTTPHRTCCNVVKAMQGMQSLSDDRYSCCTVICLSTCYVGIIYACFDSGRSWHLLWGLCPEMASLRAVVGASDEVKDGEWLCADVGPHLLPQWHPPTRHSIVLRRSNARGAFLTPLDCLGAYTQTRTLLDAGICHCQHIPAPPNGTSWRLVASPRRCLGGFPRLAHTQLAAHANRNASLRPSMSALD